MIITHVIESGGGSADFVYYIARYLPAYQHQIFGGQRALHRFNELNASRLSNFSLHHWEHAQREIRPSQDVRAFISLILLLKKYPSDVIHLHSSKAGFMGRVAGFLLRRKCVYYTPNGLAFLRKDIPPWKSNIYVILEMIANALCGKVISCSRSEMEELAMFGVKGSYISNGTELSDSISGQASNGAQFVVATVGRVTTQKNPFLFNQIALHFENDPSIAFVWIGMGELANELTSTNIRITGWLPKSKVLELVEKTDLYISTARWEGLPFAVLEAMNARKPLLLTACVGNRDLVVSDQNGSLYITAQEAIAKIKYLIHHRELLLKQGQRSYDIVHENFNVVEMAKNYGTVYQACKSATGKGEGVIN